ncbi:hypothetical protein [Halomarina rubra]|uniref:Uncharacterized protein n=1 Tax=Halomarina rubra TaxID=2071873 RepID=A0ABD6B1F4_9EURY|nr:hypothetical protein [Halomarina rubra]
MNQLHLYLGIGFGLVCLHALLVVAKHYLWATEHEKEENRFHAMLLLAIFGVLAAEFYTRIESVVRRA